MLGQVKTKKIDCSEICICETFLRSIIMLPRPESEPETHLNKQYKRRIKKIKKNETKDLLKKKQTQIKNKITTKD